MIRIAIAAMLSAALTLSPIAEAFAQQRNPSSRQQQKPADKDKDKEKEAAPAEPAPPGYDRDLMRLSEIMGALAFLRNLCAAPDASEWPSRMRALIDAEGSTQSRKDRLAGAYNRGYRSYAVTYRVCTASATEASSRFIREGEKLSESISGAYGG